MPLPLFVAFVWGYALIVSYFGVHLQWNQVTANYFLPLFIFRCARDESYFSLIACFSVGVFSDILAGHTWAAHSVFFTLFYVIYRKFLTFINLQLKSLYMISLFTLVYFLSLWDKMVLGKEFLWKSVHTQAWLTLALSIPLFYLFKFLRVAKETPAEAGESFNEYG